jgi:hypothetical protein
MSLELNHALSQPLDGGTCDPTILAAHRRLQHYDAVIIVNCANAKQHVDNLGRS